LIFVLKLDEVEIIRAQKMERVSIMLMNQALDNNIDFNSEKYFSAQLERNLAHHFISSAPRVTQDSQVFFD